MATMTKEQIEQKMQQLKQLTEQVNALTQELVEAGAIEISDQDLENVTGGFDKKKKRRFEQGPDDKGPSNAFF